MKYIYRPLLRPASFATLPSGLAWTFVEAPWSLTDRRPDLPRCTTRHGLIATARPLTVEECQTYDLKAEDGSTPCQECSECGEVLASTRERQDESMQCDRCWAGSMEHGHRHGLHVDEDNEPIIVEGCPSCAGGQALWDALRTAQRQLDVEHGAINKLLALGQVEGDFDLRFAREEIARFEALIARLQARLRLTRRDRL
jgi:hypothetical protein